MTAESRPSTGPDRRRRIPPPPAQSGLEGLGMGAELPQEIAGLLWPFLRAVTLWVRLPRERRARLFPRSAAKRRAAEVQERQIEPELAEPLGVLVELLARPGTVDGRDVGQACSRIAEWAGARGAASTQAEFTDAAARASEDPVQTLAAARLARDRADYPAAEAWYGRAIGLARRAGDWDTYARSYIGLGKMWRARGVYAEAHRHFSKAARAARQHGAAVPLGMALLDLFALEAEAHHDEALDYARAALEAYPPGHPDLEHLAYGLGTWLADRGQFAEALPLIMAVTPRVMPTYQAGAQGGLARVAAGAGDVKTFEDAFRRTEAFPNDRPDIAEALVAAALGAVSLARWEDAERTARRALEIADARGQARLGFEAEVVLETIRSERAAAHARTSRPESNAPPPVQDSAVGALARDIARSLQATSEPDAGEVLTEVPGRLGMTLSNALRVVYQWAAATAETRRGTRKAGAYPLTTIDLREIGAESVLVEPLAVLRSVLRDPTRADRDALAAACTAIADWAQARKATATAFQFMAAAALISGSPPRALAAARLARDRADHPVALSWFRRTLQLARRSGDWDTYVRAQVGISKMWYARGSFPRARRILQQALRVAQREGLDEALGMAYHELFIIASDSHHDRDAIGYAQAALHAYPPSSPNLPALAYDVAFFWVLRGEFAPALPVLKRVVPQMTIQTHGQGGLARTAGAMGDRATFDSAWQVIWELDDSEPGKADALVEAARGALSLGRHDDAERAATRGLEIASARRQMLVVMDAEAILESLRSERAVAAQGRKPVPEPSDVTPDEASALLARDLLQSLETGPDEPGISEELPQPVATVLSRALRAVRRWAQTFRSEGAAGAPHGGDPEIAAGPDELTREPLLQEALAELSDRLSTGAADPEQVADACTRIAEWAAERKASHTAIQFAVAAAEVSFEPRPALAAARMARDRADYPTAESWYQEAVERAERLGDWDTYVRAYIGMGKMWLARGAAPLARSHLLKAVEIAQREGLSDATGMAYHDLFITAAGAHWDAEAIAYAGAAARTYWPGHRLLPSLAYDVAYYWVQRGQFARALPVLKAAVPHMVPKHQIVAQGGLARAAGNVGDVQTFDSAWQTLWALDDQAPYKADGLVEAARGAASLGRWDDADRAALRGREIASARGEMRTVFEAEAVLDSVRSKRRLEQRRGAEPVQIPVPQNLPADELVRDLVEVLTAEALGHR